MNPEAPVFEESSGPRLVVGAPRVVQVYVPLSYGEGSQEEEDVEKRDRDLGIQSSHCANTTLLTSARVQLLFLCLCGAQAEAGKKRLRAACPPSAAMLDIFQRRQLAQLFSSSDLSGLRR